uniref:Uncharacterized protein n=3 Tax=Oryza TaxID=4527 RepID=Q10PP7_ORYSJ|nr:hypothetical protein LOC_Os03g12540 [Oryza sativa Japonica Group]
MAEGRRGEPNNGSGPPPPSLKHVIFHVIINGEVEGIGPNSPKLSYMSGTSIHGTWSISEGVNVFTGRQSHGRTTDCNGTTTSDKGYNCRRIILQS